MFWLLRVLLAISSGCFAMVYVLKTLVSFPKTLMYVSEALTSF